MRFLRFVAIAILYFTPLSSCTSIDTPDVVVLKFYDAMSKMDFESVKMHVSKEFSQTFDILIHMTDMDLFEAPNEGNDINPVIKSVEVSKDENTAKVVVEMVNSVGSVVDEATVPLVKEEGEWKIVIQNI